MDKVTSYIKECETEFMQLLGLTSFPIYEIAYKDISLSVSDEQGYDSLGSAHYDYKTIQRDIGLWMMKPQPLSVRSSLGAWRASVPLRSPRS